MKPAVKPQNPNFSSGPCSKYPGFSLDILNGALLGRSHRCAIAKERLKYSLKKTKEILQIPDDYIVGMVPGSDTGAIEMAMWNLLGPRGVDVVNFESFGKTWANDVKNQLKLEDVQLISADYGYLPDLSKVNFDHDVVMTWNGTTSGVKIPNGDWIPDDRKGLTIVDATSAVFAMEIPWSKVDVLTFSWQKVLGGEGAHGMLIMSPRAVERIESYIPPWPMPKVLQLRKKDKLMMDIFEGSPINTPSMLCVEDYIKALEWAESIGGLKGLIKKSSENLNEIEKFVETHDWIDFLPVSKDIRSNTSVCLKIKLDQDQLNALVKLLDKEGAAYDCKSYKDAPAGLRFWCGATVNKEDIACMLQWLEWAYGEVTKA